MCALERIHTLVTDEGVSDDVATMLEGAGVKLLVARTAAAHEDLRLPELA